MRHAKDAVLQLRLDLPCVDGAVMREDELERGVGRFTVEGGHALGQLRRALAGDPDLTALSGDLEPPLETPGM